MPVTRLCALASGHSKSGNNVLLYAAKYDNIPLVVNIAGRFDMERGIAERFGKDIFDILKKEGQVPWTTRNSRGEFKWTLTQKVCTSSCWRLVNWLSHCGTY